jgi:hypothetical protein
MKLKELKAVTLRLWRRYTEYYGDAVIQPEQFQPEIRNQFGDLRKRTSGSRSSST